MDLYNFYLLLSIYAFGAFSCEEIDATTYYVVLDSSHNPQITNTTPASNSDWVAKGNYTDKTYEDGFAYLSIASNPGYEDAYQAYSAGFLEGYLSAAKIDQMFNNIGAKNISPSSDVKNFISDNFNFLKTNVDSKKDDTYWYHVGLLFFQIKGIEDGYLGNPGSLSDDIDPLGLFWLYYWKMTELTDIVMKYAQPNERDSLRVLGSGSCSALIKNMGSDLVTSHVTWDDYQMMVRVVKKFNLPFRASQKYGNTIPGNLVLESSYPGLIHSVDDFYVTNQNLVVTETTNEILNTSLYDLIEPNGTVPYFLRISVSNRLSSTGLEWVNYFSKYNSGTYNNQWMVIDYKQFTPNQTITAGTLYVLEQLPGFVMYKDMSNSLNNGGTNAWTSFNLLYFDQTKHIDNITAYINAYGNFFDHDLCPRAQIFDRDISKAVDINSTIALMRYNDFQNDPFAKCNCTPLGFSAENGISARCELNPVNGSYSIASEGARCHGATDLKIVNNQMVTDMQMTVIAGPTHDQQPVFDWTLQTDTACKNVKHEGHPDRFEFGQVLVDI